MSTGVPTILARAEYPCSVRWTGSVAAHNRENPIPESRKRKVHFYFGQTVQDAVLETTPDGAANPADEAETEIEG